MKGSLQDNIKVFIRVRPINEKQKASNTGTCLDILSDKSIQMKDKQQRQQFSFDHVFSPITTQEQVYEKVGREAVNFAFQGFNGTIFAYGQTSSGKTHTCIGPDFDDRQMRGILPRLIDHIFQRISESPPHIQFRIKISMVQIYMQKIKDLFDPSKSDIRIRQSRTKGLYLQDVSEEYVASSEETIGLLKKGLVNRSTGQTNMNQVSSRSHMVFIITLYQNDLKDSSAKSGKIILIDLAGSQKVGKSGAEGKLLDQAKTINRSLSALGNVINSLTEQRATHVPYRDSKLTRLLQESLGGNSKTNLVINVSPSLMNNPETLSSLRFGFRAKQIKNKPKVNKEYTVAQLLVLLQKSERRNQELQAIMKELTASKVKRETLKKSTPEFIQNLLDSDNPIPVSNVQDNDQADEQKGNSEMIMSKIMQRDARYETQYNSDGGDSDSDIQGKSKRSSPNMANKGLKSLETSKIQQEFLEEKSLLVEEIDHLNIEMISIQRQSHIYKDKYQASIRESKFLNSKQSSLHRENEKLIEKFISQQMQGQDKQARIQKLLEKIEGYEESISGLAAISEKSSLSKVFGGQGGQADRLIKKAMGLFGKVDEEEAEDKHYYAKKIEQEDKDQAIKDSKKRIKQLEEEISLFQHLEGFKEAFIKEKMQFSKERQRMYEDLEDRIKKVLDLEEKLDEERDKTKNLEEIVSSEQSEKGRKILSLQKHLAEVSENFYVLKGQQSSWLKNNDKAEKKMKESNRKVIKLENDIMGYREDIEILKIQNQELQNQNDCAQSLVDFNFSEEGSQFKREPRIVKVLKSSSIMMSEA